MGTKDAKKLESASPRKERATARTRRDILEAAATALARKPEATMQEIAQEAGYSAPALYTYFPSKDAIVAGLIEDLRGQMIEQVAIEDPEGLNFRQRLELMVRRLLEVADRNRSSFQVFFMLRRSGERCVTPQWSAEEELLPARLTEWMRAGGLEPRRTEDPPDQLARLLLSTIGAYFWTWLLQGAQGRLADRSRSVVEFFLYGASGRPAA